MKKFVLLAAMAGLAACSQADTAPEPVATETVAAAPAETVLAADGGPPHGMFKVTLPDGRTLMADVSEDGTYTDTIDGEVVETGTWVQKATDTFCTTKDEEGAVERCGTEVIDDKGVWTGTNAEGEVSTIERVEA